MSSTEKHNILFFRVVCKDALLSVMCFFFFFYLLSGFDHGNPVLGLWCTSMLSSNDLRQLRVRKEVVAEPSEVRCQVERLSYTMQKMTVKCDNV